ncbi:MAG TPA: PAS domain S-box protein [Gammaproteobacteria bacterium]
MNDYSIVVGIGAAARGMKALRDLLGGLAPDSPLAIVVVFRHSDSPARPVEALAAGRPLAVVEAEPGQRLEAGHVYVASGQKAVSVQDGALRVERLDRAGQNAPIDHFLQSLARDQRERAVALVLSGTGSDGALGLKAVSDAGGMTIVEAPAAADADPDQGSLAADSVDLVLPPAEAAREIDSHARYLLETANAKALHEEALELLPEICQELLRETGHDFKHYKTSTLLRRTLRRLQVLRLASARGYLARLRADRAEAQRLFKDLLVNVTAFFRDPEAFDALAKEVVPRLLQDRSPGDTVRVWVPGCATGEEAYSLAMLLKEEMDRLDSPPQVQIFATDIDEQALSVARRGAYPAAIASEISPARLERFFVRKGDEYHVVKELRELCLFSVHSLINDPPFSRLDLVSCRNLLIYLGSHLQKRLIPLFHFALRPGGFLFLGPSESIATHRELFRTLHGKHRISQSLPTAIRPGGFIAAHDGAPTPARPSDVASGDDMDVYLLMQRIILDEFAPKGIVVEEDGKIVCAAGDLDRYLTVTPGVFQNNVVRLAREGLRVALRAALAEAAKERRKVVREGVLGRGEHGTERVRLVVQPMPRLAEESNLYLVVFEEMPPVAAASAGGGAAGQQDVRRLIEQLERELESTRSDLEKTVQDLEAANEELKSSNEELLSMNEELQSANEELQTSKEEVQAVNQSLVRANDDLENLLASTQIATIFLDERGNIRRVTAPATAIYNLREDDRDRPLADFTHRAKHMPPLPSLDGTDPSAWPVEHEVEMEDGKVYLRRVMPYTTQQGAARGMVVTFIDITERHQFEHRLRASEALYRAIGESIDYGVWVCDPEGNRTYSSESFLRLVGLTQEQCQGSGWASALHPDDRDATLAAWRECVRKHEPWDREHRFRGVDGQWHAVLARGVPVRDEHGRVICWAGINLDIGRLKRTESALRESEERFRLVADAAPVMIWMSGLDKRFTWCNRRWLEFTGRSMQEEIGDGWLDRVHPDDREGVLGTYRSSFDRRESFTVEYRLQRRDGHFRWVLETGVPLRDDSGDFMGYIGSCKDIHDRRLAEAAVRDSEQRFRMLADSAPVLIWIHGLEGCEYVNREYVTFVGRSAEELKGNGWAEALHPEDAQGYLDDYARAALRRGRFEAVARFRRHDGEYRWVQSVGLPRYSTTGEFLGYVGCSFDVSDIKRAEQTLVEADRRKDEFLAMLAHELRNPLAAIVNANLVAARRTSDAPARQWAHQVIERQSQQLTRLVDDLLDLSRISSGKVRLKKQSLDVREVLQRAVDGMRRSIEQKQQTLVVEVPPTPLPAEADPARLEQIFVNLLSNANKYTEENGTITVAAAQENGHAVVRVKDTGIGIAREMLPSIFEAFTQADASPDRAAGGLGLGLTVVKHLIQEHGGFVRAESEGIGKGSEFVVGLPLQQAVAADAPARRLRAVGPADSRKVLLVEDNLDMAQTLALLLESVGHTVVVANDGREALAKASAFHPEVVLLDLGLPGVDGYTVAQALRKEPELAGCLIVAVSGYGQERDRKRSREAGVDLHLVKPVEFARLLEVLGTERPTSH